MHRTRFIGANWKMNPPPAGAYDPDSPFRSSHNTEVVVFPMLIDSHACIAANLQTGAQYGRPEESGPFTGDVSMKQLKEAGLTHVLCGHSERRAQHGEKNSDVALQLKAAIRWDLIPIVCVGETDAERTAGKTEVALRSNIESIFGSIDAPACIIAYEPVWAIGSGKTPSAADIQEAHAFIRSLLPGSNIRIIYGGSVNGANAKEFFSQPDIDGVLVGGSSLKPDEFRAIVAAAG